MPTHYEILGVAKTASLDEIRNAYRNLARRLHPDLNPGDAEKEARFKEISGAYTVLSDERQRARYDHDLGRPAPRPGPQYQPPPYEPFAQERGRATRASYFWQYGERKRRERAERAREHQAQWGPWGQAQPPWGQAPPPPPPDGAPQPGETPENPQVFYTVGNPFEDPSSFTVAPPIDMGKPVKLVNSPFPQPGQAVPIVPHPQFGPIPGYFVVNRRPV